jgi:hypothetical protein
VFDPALHRRDGPPGIALVPAPIEVLGGDTELDDEVAREIFRPTSPRFSCHRRIRAFSSWPMITRASEPPTKLRLVDNRAAAVRLDTFVVLGFSA